MTQQQPIPDRSAPPRMRDYAEERRTFAVTVPEVYNPVIDIVEGWAADAPDDLALVSVGPTGETVAEQTWPTWRARRAASPARCSTWACGPATRSS